MTTSPANIDDYIAAFPKAVQNVLMQLRTAIQEAAPEATETINYGIPTFVLHGNLVHFAAFKNHIGFYSLPSGTAAFKKQLSAYKMGKGSVQFPLSRPMPLALIAAIVKFRVAENKAKAAKKSPSKGKTVNIQNKANDKGKKPNFLERLSAPARSALETKGITSLRKLAGYSAKELLALHGLGKATIPTLTEALSEKGLQLKQ